MDGSAATRIGVVGAGIRGAMFATAVHQHSEAELIAVCEPVAAVRDRVCGELQVPGYSDLDVMLDRHPELTAAVIATPDFAHREPAVACAERGLHLLIEKPLATTGADAEAIRRATDQSGCRVMIGFENRWNPAFAAVRAQLRSGDYGRVVNQVANLNDTVFVPTAMLSWAARSSPAWFLFPHTLDLALWLSGTQPVQVVARGVRGVLTARGIDTWDAVSASVTMADGSLAVLNSQWVLPVTSPSVFDFRYEVHTEAASFRLDVSDGGATRYDPTGVSYLQFGVHTHHGRLRGAPIDMVHDFVDLVRGRPCDAPDAAYGVGITHVIEAIHHSLDTGAPQSIAFSTTGAPDQSISPQPPIEGARS